MANAANAVFNRAGMFIEPGRFYTSKRIEAANIIGAPNNVWHVNKSRSASGNGKTWSRAFTTIQEGIDACEDSKGDIVLVAPGKYTEQCYIIGKDCISIFGVSQGGWENQMRPGDATTKYPFTPVGGSAAGGATFAVGSRNVEIAGFLFDGGGGYTGVYVGDMDKLTTLGYTNKNSASAWIHHNVFRGGSEGPYGLCLDGCSANVLVEDNIFERHTVASINITPGGSRTCQMPIIRRNEFYAANAGYGIYMYSSATTVGALMRENSFRDGPSLTYTYAILLQGAGVHAVSGNFFACTNKISAAATDFVSGNFTSAAGNSPNYVAVA